MDALKSGDLTDDLAGHPGYLIRRAQQLSVALFTEAFGHNRVTPTQALCLQVILRRPGVDQMTVARLIDIDHATAAMVIATLEKSGYVTRRVDENDRRRRTLATTRKGAALVKSMGPLQLSADQLLSVFTATEAQTFVRLLSKFVDGHASR